MIETEIEAGNRPAFRVRAKPNGNHLGFRRSGIFFKSTEWTNLSPEEMTDAIRNESMLEVETTPEGGVRQESDEGDIEDLRRQVSERDAEIERLKAELQQKDDDLSRAKTVVGIYQSDEPNASESQASEEVEAETPLLAEPEDGRLDCPYCEKDYANQETLGKHLEKEHSLESHADLAAKGETPVAAA